MKGIIEICGVEYEYNFIASWIKYIRIKKGYSQEYVSHGICSVSHLSYFENGKKTLRKDVIEDILKKMDIGDLNKFEDIGLVRQRLNDMINNIESYNYESATHIYNELSSIRAIIDVSPYVIEFKVYELVYRVFVKNEKYDVLKEDVDILDKIYDSFDDDLKYMYLFISGVILEKNHDNDAGIKRMEEALKVKSTSWLNYAIGKCLCFNNNPGRGSYYLEKALESYESSGRYLNAIWCHNYLGICFSYLGMYESSEKHFMAGIMSAQHFNVDKLMLHLHNNLSDLYFNKGDFKESIKWSRKAMADPYQSLLPVYNYIMACMKLNRIKECEKMFKIYLADEYKLSRYYLSIYFLKLIIYNFDDDIFYEEVKNKILPYYEEINKTDMIRDIKIKLTEYFEKKRKYKEANKIYKELIN